MLIERIELRLLDLPLVEPFAAAHGTIDRRTVVVVRIGTDGGSGWGECSALPEPTYSDEFAAGALAMIDEELGPRLVGHDLAAAEVAPRLAVVPGHPMATSALEMALLDVELRAASRSLAELLGATADRVPAGVALGLGPATETAERVVALAAAGFGRVKLKIAPGRDLEPVGAVLDAVAAAGVVVDLHVDGNGSYRPRHLDRLIELASSGVSAVEQPLPPGELEAAVSLVAASPVPIVADEAASSAAEVRRLIRAGALSGVSVKPARLGGLLAARSLYDEAVAAGVALTAGGMVETGLGRHALVAMAALPGFGLTGDISPARRWLAADPWPDVVMTDGAVAVHRGPGVAPGPDPDELDRLTVKRSVVTARRRRR
ncbi:MAG: enolase C-terminal domain-like protein [Acidimicrobiales bacterium]